MFGTKNLMTGYQARTKKNRLGELLVRKDKLTSLQLQSALKGQKQSGKQLGRYLCDEGIITRGDLTKTLMQQFAYRALAMSLTVFLGFSSVATPKSARAEVFNNATQVAYNYQASDNSRLIMSNKDNIRLASIQKMPRSVALPKAVPDSRLRDDRLFGSHEVMSSNMQAFTKWNDVLGKLDNAGMQNWGGDLEQYRGLSLENKVNAVNKHVNKVRYIEDKNNWNKSDYWATPAEFFTRGGDCEDFAIAKYAALKKLGVSEHRMRLAIVQDKQKNIPHAVLIVYTNSGPLLLDNQIKSVEKVSSVRHYEPIYSINRTAWWRHTT